jgi:hypothetical protein
MSDLGKKTGVITVELFENGFVIEVDGASVPEMLDVAENLIEKATELKSRSCASSYFDEREVEVNGIC